MTVKILPMFYLRTDNPYPRTRVVLRQFFYLGCVRLHLHMSLSPNPRQMIKMSLNRDPLEADKGDGGRDEAHSGRMAMPIWAGPKLLLLGFVHDTNLKLMESGMTDIEKEDETEEVVTKCAIAYEGEGDNGHVSISSHHSYQCKLTIF